MLFLYMSLSSSQLERQGRKAGWRNKVIDRRNQRNNKSLCQQIYQYSCSKGLLQTFYWPRYCLKLFLKGNAALLSIFNVWINPFKLWIQVKSILLFFFLFYFFFLLVLPYFFLVCELFNWAAESDHNQIRIAEMMLKCKWFRQSYTTSEFVTGGSRFLKPQSIAQKPFCLMCI